MINEKCVLSEPSAYVRPIAQTLDTQLYLKVVFLLLEISSV